MGILVIKSARLIPAEASSTFEPIDVPEREIGRAISDSYCSRSHFAMAIIRNAKL
jgi:hypothetical protein